MPTMPPTPFRPVPPPSPSPDDTATRLAAITEQQEAHARELAELRGIRRTLVGLVVVVAGVLLTGVVTGIQAYVRLGYVEAAVHEHAQLPMHPATSSALADLRTDLRVMQTQLAQIEATTRDTRDRVQRVEESTRAPAPSRR